MRYYIILFFIGLSCQSFTGTNSIISVNLVRYDLLSNLLTIELSNTSSNDMIVYKPSLEVGTEIGATKFYTKSDNINERVHFLNSNGIIELTKRSKLILDSSSAICIKSNSKVRLNVFVNFKKSSVINIKSNTKLQMVLDLRNFSFNNKIRCSKKTTIFKGLIKSNWISIK